MKTVLEVKVIVQDSLKIAEKERSTFFSFFEYCWIIPDHKLDQKLKNSIVVYIKDISKYFYLSDRIDVC